VWAWIRRPLPFLDDCARRFGKRFTIKLGGGRRFVLTWDQGDVKAIFTGSPEVFSGKGNDSFKHFVGASSLFVLDGEAHERHRRLIGPAFRGERMRAYGPLMAELTERAVASWKPGRRISMLDAMNEITLEVIFRAIFGVEDRERVARMRRLVRSLTGGATAALAFAPALQVDLGPVSPWGRFLATRAKLDAIIFDEIRRARARGAGREDILSQLVQNDLTDQELRDELLTLLGAGHETTTASLAWAIRWILGTPAVREPLLAEVRAGETRLLDAAIQETFRIVPPIPIVPRKLASDARLGEHELTAGTYVAPCPYLAQRDPAVFPDPERFDPGRFLGKRPGPFEHFPFGGGNRICIGLPFATFEMRQVLATLFRRADLRLVDEASSRARRKAIILVPHDGTRVVFEKRLA
jgi:cytochrome P450